MEFPTISLILVGFGPVDQKFRQTIASIRAQTYPQLEVVIIWSQYDPQSQVKTEISRLFIRSSIKWRFKGYHSNLGYAKGNNIGAQLASGKFLFIINPDVRFNPNLLHDLFLHYRWLQRHIFRPPTKSLIVMPRIANPTGKVEYSRRKINYLGISSMDFSKSTQIRRTMILSGCALLISQADYQELNGFDEKYFMYREDIDFSIRALMKGMALFVDNSLQVWHLKTDEEYRMSKWKYYYVERNRLIFSLEHARDKRAMLFAQLLFEPLHLVFAIMKPSFLKIRARIYKDIWFNRHYLQKVSGKENDLFDRYPNMTGLTNEIRFPFLIKVLNWYVSQIFKIYNLMKFSPASNH